MIQTECRLGERKWYDDPHRTQDEEARILPNQDGTAGVERVYYDDSFSIHPRYSSFEHSGRFESYSKDIGGCSRSSCLCCVSSWSAAGGVEALLPKAVEFQCSSLCQACARQRGHRNLEQSRLDKNGPQGENESLSGDALLPQNHRGRQQSTLGTLCSQVGRATFNDNRTRGSCTSQVGSTDPSLGVPSGISSSQRNEICGPNPIQVAGDAKCCFLLLAETFVHDLERSGFADSNEEAAPSSCWDQFFHSNTGDLGCRLGGMFRLGCAILTFLNFAMLGFDLELFLSPTRGLVPTSIGRLTVVPHMVTLFTVLPETDLMLWMCYSVCMTQIVLLGAGVAHPRFQALCVFWWHTTFHATNTMVWNGEDAVFRVLGLLLIFLPLHRCTLKEWLQGRMDRQPRADGNRALYQGEDSWPMWPFRLVQIEMCLIYLSAGLIKLYAPAWRDGTALWNVVHLDDIYGNLFNPNFLFGYYGTTRILTYIALAVELAIPVLLWIHKCRTLAIVIVVLFHLGMAFAMNLNLFQYIMILGWLSFLVQPKENNGERRSKMAKHAPMTEDSLQRQIECLSILLEAKQSQLRNAGRQE